MLQKELGKMYTERRQEYNFGWYNCLCYVV